MGSSGSTEPKPKPKEKFLAVEDVADHVAVHTEIKSIPPLIKQLITNRFRNAKTKEQKLKVYRLFVKWAIEEQYQDPPLKFIHALHLAKKNFEKNGECIADFNTIYDSFMGTARTQAVTLNNGVLEKKFHDGRKVDWADNTDPNAGIWQSAELNLYGTISSGWTPFMQKKEVQEYVARVDYENELFDSVDSDYELEQVKRGHSFVPHSQSIYDSPQRGVGTMIGHGYNETDLSMSAVMLLLFVMVCLCFAFVSLLLSVTSCVGCYVMGRFVAGKDENNNKEQSQPNQYQNV